MIVLLPLFVILRIVCRFTVSFGGKMERLSGLPFIYSYHGKEREEGVLGFPVW